MSMNRYYRFVADLIFPNRCPCCKAFIRWSEYICSSCIENLPDIKQQPCDKCGKTNCICESELFYENCVTATYYDGIVRDGILNLKLNNGVNFAEYFAEIIFKKLVDLNLSDEIDVVTAVPMSQEKIRLRGYNQAFEIAKILSHKIKKPKNNNILKKIGIEKSQHELNFKERVEQAKKSFSVKNLDIDIQGKTILICDDVITTSSTLNECAKILKQNGAKKVICAVIATTKL